MKKTLFLFLIFSVAITAALLIGHSSVHAVTNNNNLIDDFTFDDTTTLTAAKIDSWLNNNFPSSCISSNNGFSAPDPTGYTPFYPYVDGKYTYGSPVTAGQVIYDAALAHQINPQVLITKLQNEEQLVDGSQGCDNWRYTSAVGYACTDGGTNTHNYTYNGADPYASGAANAYTLNDSAHLVTPLYYKNGVAITSITGSCVNANVKAGFSEQVVHAAWLLSFTRHKAEGQTNWAAVSGNWNHCEDNGTCSASYNVPLSWACYSGLMTQGNFKRCPSDSTTTYYDGYATIDGGTIHIDNGATAALYVYTPHIQSFDNIFNGYFGSQYAYDSFTPHPDGTLISSGGKVYIIENGTRRWIVNGYIFDSYHFNWGLIKPATTGDINLPAGSNYDTLAPGTIFRSDKTPVYVMNYDNGVLIKQQISYTAFNNLGYSWNEVVYVPAWAVPAPTSSNILFANQHPAGTLVSGNGKVYMIDQSSKRWVQNGDAFWTNNYSWGSVKPASPSDLALADGTIIDLKEGTMIYSAGNIYVINYDSSGIQKQPVGPWECFSNRWHYITSDLYSISVIPARTGALATC